MDYQEYREEFLNTLRADSAHGGTDTEDEFLNHTFDLLVDFNELDSPEMTGMGIKKVKAAELCVLTVTVLMKQTIALFFL